MIFKVLFQEKKTEVPIRERTLSKYVEAESISEVQKKLAPNNYNIEYIFPIQGEYLEYEKQNENFRVETF